MSQFCPAVYKPISFHISSFCILFVWFMTVYFSEISFLLLGSCSNQDGSALSVKTQVDKAYDNIGITLDVPRFCLYLSGTSLSTSVTKILVKSCCLLCSYINFSIQTFFLWHHTAHILNCLPLLRVHFLSSLQQMAITFNTITFLVLYWKLNMDYMIITM